MKQLHRKDLFCWSEFNPERNLDFHSILWVRSSGNILIDPLPLTAHDQNHLRLVGGAKIIVITNSDHVRDAYHIAKVTGASIYGPAEEKAQFPITCHQWIEDNQDIVPGLTICALHGSKTPGELALILERETLITGDLIRCHAGGSLCILPETKLSDAAQAKESVKRLANLPDIKTVLVGDGWPFFNNGGAALQALVNSFK